WMGTHNFGSLRGQQIYLRYYPGVPGSVPLPVLHVDFLRADGAWPHLAARQRETFPKGLPSVRRTLQYTSGLPPMLIASAEQLYKQQEDEPGDYEEPALLTGIAATEGTFSLRALADGQRLTLRPV